MKEEMLKFIEVNNLSPFNSVKEDVEFDGESIFKNKDAKAVFRKVIDKLANRFLFKDTRNLFNFFEFTDNNETIKNRQKFFQDIKNDYRGFLQEIKIPKVCWKPKYGIIIVTESEEAYMQLKELNCPVEFLVSENDVQGLDEYDIVQVLDCENFQQTLERLPQSVFLASSEEAYLERYVELLSSWKYNLQVLEKSDNNDIRKLVNEIKPLLSILDGKNNSVSREEIEFGVSKINNEISQELKKMTISGEMLFAMLSKEKLPDELEKIINIAIERSGINEELLIKKVPVTIDEAEIEIYLRKQSIKEHTGTAEKIMRNAKQLLELPGKFEKLENLILLEDFYQGLAEFLKGNYPFEDSGLEVRDSKNLFLDNPQPISFILDDKRCSILTGANSGGKTTLIEHLIQLISLFQLGFPVSGNVKMPLFQEIYYFAKNKGSLNKGAFETLLVQMSKIKPGNKTLILADEIESVTEPGVAGKVISATCKFFLEQGCWLVVATHLGQEVQKTLPFGARVDGIEAKGLDENYELIVDHNPVLGRLANSTPELIVEKMANTYKEDYFKFVHNELKK